MITDPRGMRHHRSFTFVFRRFTHTHFCSGTSIEQALLLNIKMALQCIIHTKRQQNKNPKRRMEGISYIPSLPSSQVPFWMHSSDSPVLRLAGRHAGNLEISAFSGKMTMQRQVRRGDQPSYPLVGLCWRQPCSDLVAPCSQYLMCRKNMKRHSR